LAASQAYKNKIKVASPVVELDGDEMTRIIWEKIRNEVITSNITIILASKGFDLEITNKLRKNTPR
jgi:isocitrate dehydrogenase